jgi:hypothetical protein
LWPKLEEIGVPLGSPATVNPNNTWMQEFMKKALTLGLRIDFIAVHHYGGSDAINFIDKLKTTHDAYNRPIWVTEFAVADWSATTPLGNKYNEASVIAFMQEAIKAMDNIDWVQRYAWFDGKNAALYTSALFDSDDKITTLGKLYSGIKSNIKIGPGKDTEYIAPVDVDELLNNGGFETGKIEPWGGFKNGVVTNDGTKPNTGNYAGKIENGDGSLFQVVGVIPGKKYLLKYVSKWNETITNSFTGTIRNNNGNALLFTLKPMPMTNVWEESTYEFTVPTGVTELKIVFYKINGFPPLFLDDVSLKEIK